MPVDAVESVSGKVWVANCERGLTAFFPPDGVTIADATRHHSHLATCPKVVAYRTKTERVPVEVELARLADDGCQHAFELGGECG